MSKIKATFPDFKVEEKKPQKVATTNNEVVAMVKKDGSCIILNNIGTRETPDIRAFSRTKNEVVCLSPLTALITKHMPLPELADPEMYAAGEFELFHNGEWSHQMKSQLGALLNADDFNSFFRRKGLSGVTGKLSFFDLGKASQVFGKATGDDPYDPLKARLERLKHREEEIQNFNSIAHSENSQFSLANCAWCTMPMDELQSIDINSLAKENGGRIPFLGEYGEGIIFCPSDGNNRNKLKGEISVDAKILAAVTTNPSLGWIVEETKTGTLFCAYGGVTPQNWRQLVGEQVELKLLNVKSIDYDNKDSLVKSLQAGNPTLIGVRKDKAPYLHKATPSAIKHFAASQKVIISDEIQKLGPSEDSGIEL